MYGADGLHPSLIYAAPSGLADCVGVMLYCFDGCCPSLIYPAPSGLADCEGVMLHCFDGLHPSPPLIQMFGTASGFLG